VRRGLLGVRIDHDAYVGRVALWPLVEDSQGVRIRKGLSLPGDRSSADFEPSVFLHFTHHDMLVLELYASDLLSLDVSAAGIDNALPTRVEAVRPLQVHTG